MEYDFMHETTKKAHGLTLLMIIISKFVIYDL